MKKLRILVICLILVFLTTSGFGCKWSQKKLAKKIKPVNLVYWRAEGSPDDFGEIIARFRKLYTHINVDIKIIRPEEYKQKLLEAWAEDKGPDIFSIPITWLYEYRTKILPMPTEMKIIKSVLAGTIKKEKKLVEEKISAPSLRKLRETYIETVPNDILVNNQIYGLPLSADILALYYNRDFLNNAGIPSPPTTWDAFIEDVKLLTLLDKQGNFVVSGAA